MKHPVILTTLLLGSAGVLGQSEAPAPPPQPAPRAVEARLEAIALDAEQRSAALARSLERQLAAADRQVAEAERAVRLARADAPAPPEPPEAPVLAAWAGRKGAGRVLVLRSDATKPEAQAQMEEDMAVMLRILDKTIDRKLDDDDGPKAMGIPLVGGFGGGGVRGLFIEGHGPVFLLSVRFPLLPAASVEPEEKPKTETETEWEDARRELNTPEPGWAADFARNIQLHFTGNPARPYDAARVDQLKTGLLEALKNATHIRNLKPEETVTVSVFGTTSAPAGTARRTVQATRGKRSDDETVVVVDARNDREAKGSVLTLRARKSDVDAYAKGKLDAAEFGRKVSVAIYPGQGLGGTDVLSMGF